MEKTKLVLEDYCDGCPDIEPVIVDGPVLYTTNNKGEIREIYPYVHIWCKNADKYKRLYERLRRYDKKVKEEYGDE